MQNFLDPFDASMIDDAEVNRVRREVFASSVEGLAAEHEVLLVRSALVARSYLAEIGIAPRAAWNVLDRVLAPTFDLVLTDDVERETWSSIKDRLVQSVFSEAT